MRAFAVLVLTVGVSCVLALRAEVASGAPPAAVVGVTRTGTVVRLDARTLRLLADARPPKLPARPRSTALSPNRTKAALAFAKYIAIVDTRTLRVIDRVWTNADASRG